MSAGFLFILKTTLSKQKRGGEDREIKPKPDTNIANPRIIMNSLGVSYSNDNFAFEPVQVELWEYEYTPDNRLKKVSKNGVIKGKFRYDPLGKQIVKVEGDVGSDAETLYYYHARYYDPELGRFITEDTFPSELTDPQTQNIYLYVVNNPLKYTDPTGHSVWSATKNFFGGVQDTGVDTVTGMDDG